MPAHASYHIMLAGALRPCRRHMPPFPYSPLVGGTHDIKPPPASDIHGPRADHTFEQRVAELGREVQFLPSGNHTEWVEEMKREHDDYCASLSGGQLVKMELIRSVLLRVPSLSRPTPPSLASHRHFSRRMHPRAGSGNV
jgi:hypothetical protein